MFTQDYLHPSRHVPWGGEAELVSIVVIGQNWTGAAFVWTFAATQGGAAVITLTSQAPLIEGVSASYDAGYVHPETGQIIGATTIVPLILEATLEALVWADPLVAKSFAHDLLVTPLGRFQRSYCKGTLTIEPGVGD